MKSNDADKNLRLNAVLAAYAGGTVEIWSGDEPAGPDDVPTGTLINTLTLPDPAFDPAAGGVAVLAVTVTDPSNEQTLVPSFVRFIAPTGERRQLSCKMEAAVGDAEVVLSDPGDSAALTLYQNRALSLDSFSFSEVDI